jgi:hypothetical protein
MLTTNLNVKSESRRHCENESVAIVLRASCTFVKATTAIAFSTNGHNSLWVMYRAF